jgi:hypothetical protein
VPSAAWFVAASLTVDTVVPGRRPAVPTGANDRARRDARCAGTASPEGTVTAHEGGSHVVTNPLASRTIAREEIRNVARGWWTLLFVGFTGAMTIAGSTSAPSAMPYCGLWLSLGVGEGALSSWPGLTLVSVAIGFWSICYGIVAISASIELKALPQRIDEAQCQLAGAYSVERIPAVHTR